MFYLIFEGLIITIFGLLGSYFIWRVKRDRYSFSEILSKYGYGLGVAGAIVAFVIIIILRSEK